MRSPVEKSVLPNGVTVLTQPMDDRHTVSLGIWADTGRSHEDERIVGVAHFVEHLLFKGTPRRSARQIAEEIERRGGTIDAFTDKETTCYHARVLAGEADSALDVLSDLVLHAEPREEDLELEREVIIQEILDVEDDPEEYSLDYLLECYWPGHRLGWPVAGSVASVERIQRDDILAFLRDFRRPGRLVVSAAGPVDHDHLVGRCREIFGSLEAVEDPPRVVDRPDFRPGLYVVRREIEQAHLTLGMPGLSLLDPRREAGEVLLAALGFVIMVALDRRGARKGVLSASVAMGYATLRFPLDFLRATDLGAESDRRYASLTPAQWSCIALFALGAWALAHHLRRPSTPE